MHHTKLDSKTLKSIEINTTKSICRITKKERKRKERKNSKIFTEVVFGEWGCEGKPAALNQQRSKAKIIPVLEP